MRWQQAPSVLLSVLFYSCLPKQIESPYDGPGSYVYTSHYPNGQLHIIVDLVRYQQHGLLREYYPNGNLKFTQGWKLGQRIGETKFYDSMGSLKLHKELKFSIYNGRQTIGNYEYLRDTIAFPRKGQYDVLSMENRTLVVPNAVNKLDSLLEINLPIVERTDQRFFYSVTIPNVQFTTIQVSTEDGVLKAATPMDCGYRRIDKVNAFCFELTPDNKHRTFVDIQVKAVINQQTISFRPKRIELY